MYPEKKVARFQRTTANKFSRKPIARKPRQTRVQININTRVHVRKTDMHRYCEKREARKFKTNANAEVDDNVEN